MTPSVRLLTQFKKYLAFLINATTMKTSSVTKKDGESGPMGGGRAGMKGGGQTNDRIRQHPGGPCNEHQQDTADTPLSQNQEQGPDGSRAVSQGLCAHPRWWFCPQLQTAFTTCQFCDAGCHRNMGCSRTDWACCLYCLLISGNSLLYVKVLCNPPQAVRRQQGAGEEHR